MRFPVLIQALRETPRYSLRVLTKGRVMRQLLQSEDGDLRSLGEVLQKVRMRQFSSREGRWIGKIESLRKRLKTSHMDIEVVDFGAGRPGLQMSADEMRRGKVVKRTIGEICRTDAHPGKWALMLFSLIRKFRPIVCLELGTGLGISAAYQWAGLQLNGSGRLITLEGSTVLAGLAQAHLDELGLGMNPPVVGRFEDTLPEVLRESNPIDFVFIDGHHDGRATVSYVDQILPYLADGAVIVLDDIAWSRDMKMAWQAVREKEGIKVSLDLFLTGICLVRVPPGDRSRSVNTVI
ncbi:MAG: O-methyltransferase [Fidelibacterota bacterium]